ncbi:winged helix-turn-helix transcriptional regulator [Isoalcanivorax beigongshangi]|uniref:Winged helix-turn-helix transcriptional regulator n=1 Tax=Isoalcanivorax beigongshangi TaxID=3238810 RepID=A0ABV4AEB5_9GAMM
MSRKRFEALECTVADALDQVGDSWSLMLVKEAMQGTRRFVDFQRRLGIARNILCERLARLVAADILTKVDAGEHGTRYEYRLTDKGRDLFVVITALRQWSERWNGCGDGMVMVDREQGSPVRTLTVQGADGAALSVRDVGFVPLPEER